MEDTYKSKRVKEFFHIISCTIDDESCSNCIIFVNDTTKEKLTLWSEMGHLVPFIGVENNE